MLLGRADGYLPWLRWLVLAAGLAAAAGLLVRRLALWAAGLGLAAALAGPFAYCLTTVAEGHTGSIVTAGPAVAGGMRGPGGGRLVRMGPGFEFPQGGQGGFPGGQGGTGGLPGGAGGQNPPQGGAAPGGTGPGGGAAPGGTAGGTGGPGAPGTGTPSAPGAPGGADGRIRVGGPGGLLGGTSVGAALKQALTADADRYTWVAAPPAPRTRRATSSPPATP